MRLSARPTQAARATALLALGALAVHELRYVLAYGSHAQQAMASQGHGYLGELTPAIVVLALSAILGRLVAAAFGRGAGNGRPTTLARSAAFFATALTLIFSVQELVEGAFFAGHAGGLAAILGEGGWIALPLALAIGALAALADRLLAGAEQVLALRARRRRILPRAAVIAPPAQAPRRPPLAGLALAFGFARRPPPVLSVP